MMSFSLLRYHLTQLKFSQNPIDLIATPGLPFLLKRNSLLGRLFDQKSPLTQTLSTQAFLERIRERFLKEMMDIAKANEELSSLLMQKIKKLPFDHFRLDLVEETILVRCLWFHTFMQDFIQHPEQPYLDFLCDHSLQRKNDLTQTLEKALFFKKLKDFELATKTKIPYHILLKLSNTDTLSDADENRLKKWIEQIKESADVLLEAFSLEEKVENSYAKSPFIHRLLIALFTFYNENRDAKEDLLDLGRLEDRLEKRGIAFRTTPDPKIINTRKQYQPGYKFKIAAQEFEIEEILSNKENNPTKPILYGIKNHPELELIYYINRSQPFLEDFDIRLKHCGPKIYKIYGGQDAYILRERLHESLDTLLWVSTYEEADVNSFPQVSVNDLENVESIRQLVIHILKLPFTPYELTPAGFAYNSDKLIRATKVMFPYKISYEAIQKFVFKCACGSQKQISIPILSYLMHKTGLAALFKEYQELVIFSLKGEEKMIDLKGALKNPKKIKTRREFYDTIVCFQQNILEKLKKTYPEHSQLKEHVNEAIIDLHYKICPGSLFVPNFGSLVEEKALQSILKETRSLSKEEEQEPSFFGTLGKKLMSILG